MSFGKSKQYEMTLSLIAMSMAKPDKHQKF